MRFKVSPFVSECELFEIRQTVHFFPSRVALCGSSVSPSKSDCPLFEIQKVDTSKFGSVHFSDATRLRKNWTVAFSNFLMARKAWMGGFKSALTYFRSTLHSPVPRAPQTPIGT